MGLPNRIAAIDAGSNALRLVIADCDSHGRPRPIFKERAAVRLGRGVFVNGALDEDALTDALGAFHRFALNMKEHKVGRYRAVATSAAREASNGEALVGRIRQETGLALEIISGAEETLLQREAVLNAVGKRATLGMIADLGGGSLEWTVFQNGQAGQPVSLPLGTVRLMETLGITGSLLPTDRRAVLDRLEPLLNFHLRPVAWEAGTRLALTGGNAEALARIAPGNAFHGTAQLDLALLEQQSKAMLTMEIEGRMAAYRVKRDRAEVMAIAAMIFVELGRRLDQRLALIPGVGVREGLLLRLAAAQGESVGQ